MIISGERANLAIHRFFYFKKLSMTKREMLELLDFISMDDEIYIELDGEIKPVCVADSDIEEINITSSESILIAVLLPCKCGEEIVEEKFEIKGEINLN